MTGEPITRTDAKLIERAVRLQWELPPALAQELPEKLTEMVGHEDPRIAIRAARTLIEMNAQNTPTDQGKDSKEVQVIIYGPEGPPQDDPGPGVFRVMLPDNGRG